MLLRKSAKELDDDIEWYKSFSAFNSYLLMTFCCVHSNGNHWWFEIDNDNDHIPKIASLSDFIGYIVNG